MRPNPVSRVDVAVDRADRWVRRRNKSALTPPSHTDPGHRRTPPSVRLPRVTRDAGCPEGARAFRAPGWCSDAPDPVAPPHGSPPSRPRRSTRFRSLPLSFTSRLHPRRAHPSGQPGIPGFPKPRVPERRRTTPSTPRHRHPGNPGPPGRPNPLPHIEGYSRGCVQEALSGAGLTNLANFVVQSAVSTPDASVRG